MSTPARLLIAEDHAVVRDGLRASLEAHRDDFEIVGEVDNGFDALEKTRALRPDLVLLDIRMPDANGTDVLQDMKKRVPETSVLIFTQFQTETYVQASIEAGADGYFVKNDGFEALIGAMRDVLSGKVYLSPRVAHFVVRSYKTRLQAAAKEPSWTNLTAQERKIIKLVAEGKTNKDIASLLSLSKRTIEAQRASIMRQLGLDSVSDLVRYALENDIA